MPKTPKSPDARVNLRVLGRKIPGTEDIEGYVVGEEGGWVLVARLSDRIELDGWTLLRSSDLTGYDVLSPIDDFARRALVARDHWPPRRPRGLHLENNASVMHSLTRRKGLLSIFRERRSPDECLIGRPVGMTGRSIRLELIDSLAVWTTEVESFRISEITRVDFGGGYEEALWLARRSDR